MHQVTGLISSWKGVWLIYVTDFHAFILYNAQVLHWDQLGASAIFVGPAYNILSSPGIPLSYLMDLTTECDNYRKKFTTAEFAVLNWSVVGNFNYYCVFAVVQSFQVVETVNEEYFTIYAEWWHCVLWELKVDTLLLHFVVWKFVFAHLQKCVICINVVVVTNGSSSSGAHNSSSYSYFAVVLIILTLFLYLWEWQKVRWAEAVAEDEETNK
jgi:hypothetical protein